MDKLRCLRTVGAVAIVVFLISCGRNDTVPETATPSATPGFNTTPGSTVTPGQTISPTPRASLTPVPAVPIPGEERPRGQSSGTATTTP